MIHLKTPYQLGGIIKLTILKANTIAISLFILIFYKHYAYIVVRNLMEAWMHLYINNIKLL